MRVVWKMYGNKKFVIPCRDFADAIDIASKLAIFEEVMAFPSDFVEEVQAGARKLSRGVRALASRHFGR